MRGRLPAKFDLRPALLDEFQAIQTDAGVEPVGTLHDVRKSYATHMAHHVAMHVLREIMGHASIETTATFYTRTTEDDAARVRQALAG